MKTLARVVLSLATGFLMACGAGPEASEVPVAAEETAAEVTSSIATDSNGSVSAQACTTLRRPRYSSYWQSFPIQPDGEVGGCETADDCTVTCWGEQTRNVIHSGMFNCTYCR